MDNKAEIDSSRLPRHVAIIMDGNGRWARRRGLPRLMGHRSGVKAVRRVIEEARQMGIAFLTLYAFSTENWNRPREEVEGLMELLYEYLEREFDNLKRQEIRLLVIGEIERMPAGLQERLHRVMEETASFEAMTLNLALSYGGRAELARACRKICDAVAQGRLKCSEITPEIISSNLYTAGQPDPDLVIRTSGEMRLSNFLLFQSAYSEIYVTETLWPDFTPEEFRLAIRDYQRRERRFGKV